MYHQKYIVLLCLLLMVVGCENKQKVGEKPPPLFPEPKIVALNTEEGYQLNQLSGDSIQAIILENGDTLVSGVPLTIKGRTLDPDSLSKPKVIPYSPSNSEYTAIARQEMLTEDIPLIPLNEDSLKSVLVEEIGINDTKHYVLNSTGDTIKTGIPIATKGKVVTTKQPKSYLALPPSFKDATSIDLQYLDVDHGLPTSYIGRIIEDQKGKIWIASDVFGVMVFDGHSFNHFTVKEGLSSNSIVSLLQDKTGNIWFATYGGGVSMYDGAHFTHFTEQEGLTNNEVFAVEEDSKGNLWFGTWGSGASMYTPSKDGKGGSFTHFTMNEGLSSNYISCISEDKFGNIWFATGNGGLSMLNLGELEESDLASPSGNQKAFVHYTADAGLAHNMVWTILEDQEGDLWFGTEGGISKLSRNQEKSGFTNYSIDEGLSDNSVLCSLEDQDGNLWFGTYSGGLNMYDGKSFSKLTKTEGLTNNYVGSVFEDRSGKLWIGTSGGGLNMFDRNSFVHFTEESGLSDHNVWSVLEDRSGKLWFGTYGGGLNKLEEDQQPYTSLSFSHITANEDLGILNVVCALEDMKGNIWFGTYGQGLFKFDGSSFTHYTISEGLSNNAIYALHEDREGKIWIGTFRGGICIYDPPDSLEKETFTLISKKDGLSSNNITSIIEDRKGNLWFGTNGEGICKYDGEVFTHLTEKEGLSSNAVTSLKEDHLGNLWIATSGGGVNIFDGNSFTIISQKEGISNDVVWSIAEDEKNAIWLSTESGINHLMPIAQNDMHEEQNREPIRYKINRFNKIDGLRGMDFYINSSHLDSKGRIWWGNSKGLSMLDLKNYKENLEAPLIHLSQVDIDETFIDYGNLTDSMKDDIIFDGVQLFENYPLELELPYTKNHLTFHYVATDWSAPHKIQYSHFMEGLNTNWSKPTNETKADYRNLPHGEYVLKIRAIGESGEWSEVFEYPFKIHPPWWQTWWARGSYGIAGVLIVIGSVRLRTAQLKKRQKELEIEVNNATQEIRAQKNEVEKQRDEVTKQKEIVEVAHQEIRDSIAYAKRIQSAILPPQKIVKEYLPQSFIFYKPKDVVAGDFYWLEHTKNKVLFAACDCTGHGVPGAMVSVICNNGLNRSVREHGLTEPGKILDKTREIVIKEFEKSEENVQDGMDVALCSLEGEKIQYAGANNPLWIIRKDSKEVEEIKADKQPIGKYDAPKPYTTHELTLKKGDTIYLFSDGFVDQFGGDTGKKFKSPNFKRLLLSFQDLDMDQQKSELEKTFDSWKGYNEQIDDVCVIGYRAE